MCMRRGALGTDPSTLNAKSVAERGIERSRPSGSRTTIRQPHDYQMWSATRLAIAYWKVTAEQRVVRVDHSNLSDSTVNFYGIMR